MVAVGGGWCLHQASLHCGWQNMGWLPEMSGGCQWYVLGHSRPQASAPDVQSCATTCRPLVTTHLCQHSPQLPACIHPVSEGPVALPALLVVPVPAKHAACTACTVWLSLCSLCLRCLQRCCPRVLLVCLLVAVTAWPGELLALLCGAGALYRLR